MAKISTIEELEAAVGSPHPRLQEKVLSAVDEYARAFIERSPLIVLSTADGAGRLDSSPKGDDPGFVTVVDEKTLLIPDRPGNKLAYGHRNVLENPQVSVLFLIPDTRETLRVNGRAELTADADVLEELAARGKPATLATRVSVDECFFHCGKALIRSRLWQPDSWGESHKVSFGKMYAARKGGEAEVAASIDEAIEVDYRENL